MDQLFMKNFDFETEITAAVGKVEDFYKAFAKLED
jgi:hypothetical protein